MSTTDEQERHFIGDLLRDEDAQQISKIDRTQTSQVPFGDMISINGPHGANRFWPEPPPPYSASVYCSPHWNSFYQRPVESFPIESGIFGQPPAATTVTRTDFYHAPFTASSNWNAIHTAPLEPCMQHDSDSPHQNQPWISQLKRSPVAIGHIENHYRDMYYHHHNLVRNNVHYISKPADVMESLVPCNYASLNVKTAYDMVDESGNPANSAPTSPLNASKDNSSLSLTSFTTSPKESAVAVSKAKTAFSKSKSYRDAASRTDHVISHHSVNSRYTALGNLPNARAISDNSSPHSAYQKMQVSSSVPITARVPNPDARIQCSVNARKNASENKAKDMDEFQKITHRKNKGVKGRNEVISDQNAIVDKRVEPSRFSVLQSIATSNNQLSSASKSVPPSTTTLSIPRKKNFNVKKSAECQKYTRKNGAEQQLGTQSAEQKAGRKNPLKKSNYVVKPLGSDTNYREQRGAVTRRRNSCLNYIYSILIFLLCYLEYFMHRLMYRICEFFSMINAFFISLTILVYTNFVAKVQAFCKKFGENTRKFWDNLCSFNAKKLSLAKSKEIVLGTLIDDAELPAIGEELVNRLLYSRGQDAYGILGLNPKCSDQEINHYYKRQAFLVSSNQYNLVGAVEAFEMLSHAYDAVNSPESRSKLSSEKTFWNNKMEKLWQGLYERVSDVRTSMLCKCGLRHAKFIIDGIQACEARYCGRCSTRHPAKHNDIWAETRFCGLIWVYYLCLDDVIYDISQWASCRQNNLQHMKANSHKVLYCLENKGPYTARCSNNIAKNERKSTTSPNNRHLLNHVFNGCSMLHRNRPYGYLDMSTASQQASYRPPERRSVDSYRPRRAGRRKKLG